MKVESRFDVGQTVYRIGAVTVAEWSEPCAVCGGDWTTVKVEVPKFGPAYIPCPVKLPRWGDHKSRVTARQQKWSLADKPRRVVRVDAAFTERAPGKERAGWDRNLWTYMLEPSDGYSGNVYAEELLFASEAEALAECAARNEREVRVTVD